jgi:phosphoglycolate phosphatase-like HAD superfamily hydrolase
MKGTVVFDFDYTLADTAAFKRALADAPDEAVARMGEFLFEGAPSMLGRLKADGWKLALLTLGDPDWQARKLARSGILPLFDYVLCTAEPKAARIAEILAWPAPLVFVNDNGEEIDQLRDALPRCRMIAVPGPKAPPTRDGVVVCGNLEEVYSAVISG